MGSQASFSFSRRGGQIGAAGGGALLEDQTHGETHGQSAEDAGQQGVHGLPVMKGQQIHKHGGDEHSVQRAYQQLAADKLPAQQKQGNIEHDDCDAHRDDGEQVMDDLGKAGQTAEGNGVGLVTPDKAQGVNGGAQGDDQKGDKLFFCNSCFHGVILRRKISTGSSGSRPGPPP